MTRNILLAAVAMMTFGSTAAQAQAYKNSRYYNERTGHLDYNRRPGNRLGNDEGVYFGLRIGPSFSTVNSDYKTLDGGKTQTGLNVGAVAGVALSERTPVYLEGGLFYTEKGGKKKLSDGKKMTYDLNYLEVPITVKYVYSPDGHFSVQPFAGGYLACGVGGKIKNYRDREADPSFSSDRFKRFDGGLRVGCGFAYDMFYADLSYDIGLANICHDEFDTSHNGCLNINFGVNF